MTSVARFLLVLTSLAPILVVRAFVSLGGHHYEQAFIMIAVVAVFVLCCVGLLISVRQRVAATSRMVADPSAKEAESIAFFVAYALPLISASPAASDLWGLGAFAAIMALASYQVELYYVNPLLTLFGYKFHAAKADNGSQVLVMSRQRAISSGELTVVEISSYLWLQLDNLGGVGGRTTRRAAGSDGPSR
jgi:hypothetical protein